MPELSTAPSAETRRARFRVIGMFGGFKVSQAIYCAVALGLPDALEREPLPIGALAQECGCGSARLEGLMAALCAAGIFARTEDRYAATPLSGCLCAGAPGSLASMILFQGNELYRAYSHLLSTLRSGVPGWHAEFGCDLWEYLERHPERSALFDRSMAGGPENDLEAIAGVGDGARHVVDIGGGNGWLLRRLLERQHAWTGTLFDRPEVTERARQDPAMRSLGERCRVVGGDFFREVPAGADLYLMRHVLHDWSDEECIAILSSCRRAMSPSSKLIVIEAPMGAGGAKGMAEWSHLSMLLIGGAERPVAQYRALLAESGFSVSGTREIGTELFVIEAERTE